MFRIKWKSKITGYSGRGTARFTYKEAEKICEKANLEHPDIRHWPSLL